MQSNSVWYLNGIGGSATGVCWQQLHHLDVMRMVELLLLVVLLLLLVQLVLLLLLRLL